MQKEKRKSNANLVGASIARPHFEEITKKQKGITLIALIITIIVMLILVGVTVTVALKGGLFKTAKQATEDTQTAVKQEKEMLEYEYQIAKAKGATQAKTLDEYILDTKYNGVKIGDYIDYKANVEGYSDTNGWRVLGTENGQILLVSARNLGANYTLAGKDGYYNGVQKLNEQCEPFGHGEYATGARSITVGDINKITGYNPEKTGNGEPYGKGETYQYGNEVTYTLNSGKVAYSSSTKSAPTSFYYEFEHVDGRVLGSNGVNSITVKSTYYWYNPKTLTDSNLGETKGIETSSPAYDMLFNNTSWNKGSYWLASPCEIANPGFAYFSLRCVNSNNVSSDSLWNSESGSYSRSGYRVRAVISLKSEIQLTPGTTDEKGVTHWSLPK